MKKYIITNQGKSADVRLEKELTEEQAKLITSIFEELNQSMDCEAYHPIISIVEKKPSVTRLAIINHDTHELFIEDVLSDEIEAAGGEQEYIEDNYDVVKNGGNYSWDYITDIEYIPNDLEKMPMEIEPTQWL